MAEAPFSGDRHVSAGDKYFHPSLPAREVRGREGLLGQRWKKLSNFQIKLSKMLLGFKPPTENNV